jgi:hypothetical protein
MAGLITARRVHSACGTQKCGPRARPRVRCHPRFFCCSGKDVDARNKSGHDDRIKGLEKRDQALPGGARAGHASLMRPNRPLPMLPFAKIPLRRNPNDAAAIIAAKVSRGHRTSVRFGGRRVRSFPTSRSAHTLILVSVDAAVNGYNDNYLNRRVRQDPCAARDPAARRYELNSRPRSRR